ncbi:helix-turn-helix transcriptional regulator [Capnocytophaga sp. ARDL2]|uniref:helix-turn-helix transcriptional regulator n=1 Tax=Capnocytophaga sp. ARDL2 TaxID=3238809 RepID=UPI0035580D9D
MDIRERLKEIRLLKGLSVRATSKAIGSSRQAIMYFERGEKNPTFKFAQNYANKFGYDILLVPKKLTPEIEGKINDFESK